jgi:hypothetical protein
MRFGSAIALFVTMAFVNAKTTEEKKTTPMIDKEPVKKDLKIGKELR